VGKFFLIALVLAASSAEAAPSCVLRADTATCLATLAAASSKKNAPKVADVLCCCKTASGGECCTRAAVCGGKMPGCFCASPGKPIPPQPPTSPPAQLPQSKVSSGRP
jgi:hypothetical protein